MANTYVDRTSSGDRPPDTCDSGVCVVCRTAPAAGEQVVSCIACGALHHADCWDYNGGCGKYGCPQAPATDKLGEMEIPASFWGRTDKECPQCRQVIQAAALRCRFCGTVFGSNRPLQAEEFHAGRQLAEGARRARAGIIWLLIASIVPCTAPLALIVGGIWFMHNRAAIARLPAMQSAMAHIGVGLAGVQTVGLVVVGVLYSLFRG